MKKSTYLFDTHALIFWNQNEAVTKDFIKFFDKQEQQGFLYVSSISFWEIALLAKRGRIAISDIHAWKNEILQNTNIHLIEPSAAEMIDSTLLPDIHKDRFDRLLIAQARQNEFILVTRDNDIQKYDVDIFWETK